MQDRAITFASTAFFITSIALASDTWILDSSKSNARLFHGSTANPESSNTAVGRVAGKVKLDTNDLETSIFDLSIYPTDRTLLTFKSTRILRTGSGRLEVIGDLA